MLVTVRSWQLASIQSTGKPRTHLSPSQKPLSLTPHRAFNFGIPSFPWINGRDLAGIVISAPSSSPSSRIHVGDLVLVPSTDYRDIRKAAFQQYAIATSFNAARIPQTTCRAAAAAKGVAFVTAALALGVCFGADFSGALGRGGPRGPSLPDLLARLERQEIPEDIREQCLAGSRKSQRIQCGDWLAIWGGKCAALLPPYRNIH